MAHDPSLLALRLLDEDFALEPGREYLMGSGPDCDIRIDGQNVAPHHARLLVGEAGAQIVDLGSQVGTCRNGDRVDCAHLEAGDSLQLGDCAAVVVRDEGQARILPLPEMVADAGRRRLRAALPPLCVRRFEERDFRDLMAEELARAPWFAVSLVVHAAILLLLWLLFPAHAPSGDARATVNLDLAGTLRTDGVTDVRSPEVLQEESELPVELDDVVDPPPVVEPDPPEEDLLGQMQQNPRLTRRPDPPRSDAARSTSRTPSLSGIGSAGFQQTVDDLQSGLEIVFVFDSTGSMGVTIKDTKATIVEMLTVLRALVPGARVGLVTFRDRGRDEDYVVREVPLGHDFWQASNFVQGVAAEGGGNRPEAVYDGLQAAFRQSWRRDSKRVVVLAGDAPAHRRDRGVLMSEVAEFVARGNTFVHTLVTSPRDAGPDTHELFRSIAQAGNGECLPLEDHEQVLKRVLEFAFGRQYGDDLAEARDVLKKTGQTATWALDLSRRGGSDLELALRERHVDAALLNALVRLPKRRVVEQLIRTLGYPKTPTHTRQAVAWVLQRVFDLSQPPIDAVTGEPASERTRSHLLKLAKRLPE